MPAMDALPPLITDRLADVRALCEKYHVKRLTLFGSAAKGTFDPEKSDVDFVVEFEWDPDPLERGRRGLELRDELKNLFGRKVDLVQRKSIINPFFLQVLELTQRSIYESDRAA